MNQLEGFATKNVLLRDYSNNTSLNRELYGFSVKQMDRLRFWCSVRNSDSMYQEISSPTTLAVANGDPVGTWKDVSPNRYLFNTASNSYRPTLVNNSLNGFPGLQHDGVDDYLTTASLLPGRVAPITVITVLKFNSFPAASGWVWLQGQDRCADFLIYNNGSSTIWTYNGYLSVDIFQESPRTTAGGYFTVGSPAVVAVVYNRTSTFMRVNKTIGTFKLDHLPNMQYGYLGNPYNNNKFTISGRGGPSQVSNTTFYEIMMYEKAASPSDLDYIFQYFGKIYGIAV